MGMAFCSCSVTGPQDPRSHKSPSEVRLGSHSASPEARCCCDWRGNVFLGGSEGDRTQGSPVSHRERPHTQSSTDATLPRQPIF